MINNRVSVCLIFIYWRFSVQFVTKTSHFTLTEINGLVYKPHPRFLTQNLSKKVWLMHESLRYVLKDFSIHQNFDRGLPKVSLLRSGLKRQHLSYLSDQAINGIFSSWNRKMGLVWVSNNKHVQLFEQILCNKMTLSFIGDCIDPNFQPWDSF